MSKKVYILKSCTDLSKEPKSVEAIYIYAPGRSHYTLSENGLIYRSPSHYS